MSSSWTSFRAAPGNAQPPHIDIDPTDPCCLLLSGGTTGIPKLIPRTHNDYVYNSRAAAAVHYIGRDSCQLAVAPLAHNMPLACPGVQGFLMHGARVVLSEGTRASEILPLVERHRITHIAAVPALYIRWLADPVAGNHDMSSVELLQSGGQRLQPELRRQMAAFFPNAFVQENFGMSEGTLFFVTKDLPEEARMETVGLPVSPDDEVGSATSSGAEVPDGEVGELTVRGPYTSARVLPRTRVQRASVHPGRLLPLRGPHAASPVGCLPGRGAHQGPDQSWWREDQRGGDRESDPHAPGGAQRRLRARTRTRARRAHVRLRDSAIRRTPHAR